MSTPNIIVPSPAAAPEGQAGLVNQAARSVKWSFLYNIVPRLVTPFSTLILAALLTPVDFGLVAISTLVIALARIVVDMGLSTAVVQRQTQVAEGASVSLWASLFISAGLYLILWAAAPYIAVIYDNDRVCSVIRVAALALPLTALVTVPKALLQRGMRFRSLFWVNSSFLILQSVASVLLALTGIGYWALILGQLVGMAIAAGIAWSLVRWRPMVLVSWPILRSMLGFSIWVMLSAFMNWMFLYADNAIAGVSLGVRGLGIYALGFTIATLVPGFLIQALADVAYPAFCKLQGDPCKVGENLLKLQALTVALLLPLALGILALAPPAVELLYGQKWLGLGTVIAILVIMPGLGAIWSLNENAYQAIGRPSIWTKLAAGSLLVLLPSLWLAAPYGLLVFTLVRFAGAWLLPLGNVFIGARTLKLTAGEQLRAFAPSILFSAAMFIVVYGLTWRSAPFAGLIGWAKLLAIAAAGAIVYLSLVRLGNRELWDRLLWSLHRMLARGNTP
jgi:O-antigen/teichoic acid export membrane protein